MLPVKILHQLNGNCIHPINCIGFTFHFLKAAIALFEFW